MRAGAAGTGSARAELLGYTAEPARHPIPGCGEHALGWIVESMEGAAMALVAGKERGMSS